MQSSSVLYADDTALVASDKCPKTLKMKIETDLRNITSWCNANKLKLNLSKTQCIYFGTNHSLKNIKGTEYNLKLDGVEITRSKSVSYLGIHLDEKLSFSDHINFICKKTSQALGSLSSIKHLFPIPVRKKIYPSLVLSNLHYCNTIWMTTNTTNLNRIATLYNRTCRAVLGVKVRELHSYELYSKLGWLTFDNWTERCIATEAYKINILNQGHTYVQAPSTFSHIHPYNTRGQHNFALPNLGILGRKAYWYRVAEKWNNLDPSLKQAQSLNIFKRIYFKKLLEHQNQVITSQ